jgi:hypothetical protein
MRKIVVSLMGSGAVSEFIEKRYPGARAKVNWVYPYRNSQIFMVDLEQVEENRKIVVKLSRNHKPEQVAAEYENLSRFYNGCKDSQISSPEPLFVEPQKGFLAMSYVDGLPLAHMLHEVRPASREYIHRAVDLSAVALAEYHRLFRQPEDEAIAIDPTVKENDINRCIAESRAKIDECSLRCRVTPFFDFTAWNIMMENDGKSVSPKLYLIDFPRLDYVFTPHLDLARFRFGLELVKQFPPAKFLGINRWEVEPLFSRFFSRYCHEMRITPNQEDLRLIACFRKANICRSQDLLRKGKFGWQPRLEKAYLKTFCREWLEQRDDFAGWPGNGHTKRASG